MILWSQSGCPSGPPIQDERAKVDNIKQELSELTQIAYDEAATYHDGKWLLLKVDHEETLADVERVLAVKRLTRPLDAPVC